MAIKSRTTELALRAPLGRIVAEQIANGFFFLPIELDHVLAVEALPPVHRDPFDRIIIAQAIVEGAEPVSADRVMSSYPVSVLW